jgi:hypothetical protein
MFGDVVEGELDWPGLGAGIELDGSFSPGGPGNWYARPTDQEQAAIDTTTAIVNSDFVFIGDLSLPAARIKMHKIGRLRAFAVNLIRPAAAVK